MQRAEQGFTLLELMIVLVVMGIVLAMAGVSTLQDDSREAGQQARGVVDLAYLGRQLAVLEGREYGLCIVHGRVRLLHWDGATWQPQGQGLSTDLELKLKLDGLSSRLPDNCSEPQVLIASSDEIGAFKLLFESQGRQLASVVSDGLAELRIND